MISKEMKAAIIGYWRSGATIEEIKIITRLPDWMIQTTITNHQNEAED